MKVNEIITSQICEAIKTSGELIWRKPWNVMGFRNVVSKKAYRGVNVLMLMAFAPKSSWFMTFNQAKALKRFVKAGSKGIPICFWTKQDEKKDKATGALVSKGYFLLRYYRVFPLEATEGAAINLPVDKKLDFKPLEEAERAFNASGAKLSYGGDRAYYAPFLHDITLPAKESFHSIEEYYATLFHELTHWIGGEMKTLDVKSFGSEPYSKEELVAEIGANFFASYCGIDISKFQDNSTAYLKNWLSRLENDPNLIISAASQAQKRFDWLMNKLNPTEATTEATTEVESESELVAA